MQAYQIQDTRTLMQQLFAGDTFHSFLVSEVELKTFVTYKINGKIHPDYYDTSDAELLSPGDLCTWKNLQPMIYDLVKGKRTPLSLQIVLKQSPSNVDRFLKACGLTNKPSEIDGLYLNIRYDGKNVTCITGTSLRIFSLDKSLENCWDDMIARLLKKKNIPFVISTQH